MSITVRLAGVEDAPALAGLVRFLAAICIENGIRRIDFPTDLGSEAAQKFYRRLGAKRFEAAGYHRLSGETLRRLAADEA